MTDVTIFGQGNMGTAIAGVLTKGGATVTHIGSADTAATVTGDIVVLAVPHPAVDAIVAAYGDQLAGKTVVDITNPLDFATFDSLVVPADSSKAAEIAAQLPSATVLKAFNTNFAATLASGQVGDAQPTTVLVAGDDADAKQTLCRPRGRRWSARRRCRFAQAGPRAGGHRLPAADRRRRRADRLDRRLRRRPLTQPSGEDRRG